MYRVLHVHVCTFLGRYVTSCFMYVPVLSLGVRVSTGSLFYTLYEGILLFYGVSQVSLL